MIEKDDIRAVMIKGKLYWMPKTEVKEFLEKITIIINTLHKGEYGNTMGLLIDLREDLKNGD